MDSTLESPFLQQSNPASSMGWMLDKERLTVGRDPSSDVRIDDPTVSMHHADLVRRESEWAIVDAGSVNGTWVNGDMIHDRTLRGGDRIKIGTYELVLRMPSSPVGAFPAPPPIQYDIESQSGNVSNVAGNQTNYMTESNLRYIASRRGRARLLIVWGIVLFILGQGIGLAAVLSFQGSIFGAIDSNSFRGPDLPNWFLPAFGAGAFLTLIGIAMFIFGLIARSGAKREARVRGVEWS
jgi:FHA domain